MTAPDRIWTQRKTLPGDPAENGYWETRHLGSRTMAEYVRADLVDELSRDVVVTDAMIEAGLEHYEQGDWIPLDEDQQREVVSDIIRAALARYRGGVTSDE